MEEFKILKINSETKRELKIYAAQKELTMSQAVMQLIKGANKK